MGRAARQKGKRGERETATKFRVIFGDVVKRGWQARQGSDAPDVDGTPFWIENKRRKQISIPGAIKQALTDRDKARDARPVLVVAQRDREAATATMLLEDFLLMVAALHRGRSALFDEAPKALLLPSRHEDDFDLT